MFIHTVLTIVVLRRNLASRRYEVLTNTREGNIYYQRRAENTSQDGAVGPKKI